MTPTSKEHVRGEYLAQLTAQCGMITDVQHEGKEVVRKGERKEMTQQSESSLLPDRLPTFTQITLPLSVNSPPLSSCAGRTHSTQQPHSQAAGDRATLSDDSETHSPRDGSPDALLPFSQEPESLQPTPNPHCRETGFHDTVTQSQPSPQQLCPA